MLWVKALHVFFVIAWFAGLFYLPRLFVYHHEVSDSAGRDRFVIMERKLYALMTVAMIGTWVFGIWLIMITPGFMQMGWLHAKLTLVVLLSGYQGWLKVNLRKFAAGNYPYSGGFWRIANEVPAVALLLVLILVIVKPF